MDIRDGPIASQLQEQSMGFENYLRYLEQYSTAS